MTLSIHVGASGMGKTWALARIAEAYAFRPKDPWVSVLMDPKSELHRATRKGVIVAGPKGASEAVRRGARLLIWRGGPEMGSRPNPEQICSWALDRGGVWLGFPECHTWLPNTQAALPLPIVETLTGYRHRGLAIALDSQRLVQISTLVRGNADRMLVFGVVGRRDLDELAELGGSELADAARECARRRRDPPIGLGERGHYVDVDMMAADPPYVIKRFT